MNLLHSVIAVFSSASLSLSVLLLLHLKRSASSMRALLLESRMWVCVRTLQIDTQLLTVHITSPHEIKHYVCLSVRVMKTDACWSLRLRLFNVITSSCLKREKNCVLFHTYLSFYLCKDFVTLPIATDALTP